MQGLSCGEILLQNVEKADLYMLRSAEDFLNVTVLYLGFIHTAGMYV